MKKPLVIAITGGTSSGKSTLTRELCEALKEKKVHVIETDRYFKDSEHLPHMISPVTGKDYEDHNHPETIHFGKFKSDTMDAINNTCYDVVILEGVFTLNDEDIRKECDLKLYIDVPSDERLYRRIKRNIEWGQNLDDIAEFYLESVKFRHDEFVEPMRKHADLILNGTIFSSQAILVITEWISNHS